MIKVKKCTGKYCSSCGNPAQFTLAINDPRIIQLGADALCLECAIKLQDKLIKIIKPVLKKIIIKKECKICKN